MSSHADSDEERTTKRAKTQHQEATDGMVPVAKFNQLKKELEKERSLRIGTYYATFDEVWDSEAVRYEDADYDAMTRAGLPSYQTLDSLVKTPFDRTIEKANDREYVAANDKRTQRTSHGSLKARLDIWPVDIFHSKFDVGNNGTSFLSPTYPASSTESIHAQSSAEESETEMSEKSHQVEEEASLDTSHSIHAAALEVGGEADTSEESQQVKEEASHDTSNESKSSSHTKFPSDSDIAHLVPASSSLASLYHHVAIWVFGLNKRTYEPSVIQKLIHGSKPLDPKPTKKSGQRAKQSRKSAQPPSQRATGTGLKHMICNKIRLSGQYTYFDRNPCLIIVPVLSLQQAKEWKGEGYHAIVMLSRGNKEKGKGKNLQEVASKVGMQNRGVRASQREIDVAQDLLTATVKALAYALFNKSEGWVPEGSTEALRKVKEDRTLVNGDKLIKVPKKRRRILKPVLKITFAPAFGPVGTNGHPAPDPILLAVKAAVNWSAFHKEKLMAAGGVDESDSDLWSESSLAAMEQYLEKLKHYDRARQYEEIMNLGEISVPHA